MLNTELKGLIAVLIRIFKFAISQLEELMADRM